MVALAAATPVTDSLENIVSNALGTTDALQIGIYNFGVSKAIIVPSGTNIASVTGATGVELLATFTPEEPTKSTSIYTVVLAGNYNAPENLLGALVEPATGDLSGIAIPAPKLSVVSLIGKIEDVQINDLAAGGGNVLAGGALIVVLDQTAQTVKVYKVSDGNEAGAHAAALALAESVQYVLTEVPSTPRIFGE